MWIERGCSGFGGLGMFGLDGMNKKGLKKEIYDVEEVYGCVSRGRREEDIPGYIGDP